MKASDLKPGQFFEFTNPSSNRAKGRKLFVGRNDERNWRNVYSHDDFTIGTCLDECEVTPLAVTGWDDVPVKYKLPDGFIAYDGSGKPNLPNDTEVEFCLRSDEGKPTDVTTVGGLGWSWDDEDYSPGGDVIGYRVVDDHIPDAGKMVEPPKLQLREGGYYRRRDGKVVGPVEPYNPSDDRHYKQPWKVWNGEYNDTYYDDGHWNVQREEQPQDLIAEVPPPVEPGTQPEPATISPTHCKAESTSDAGEKFTNNGVNSLHQFKAGDSIKRNDWVVCENPYSCYCGKLLKCRGVNACGVVAVELPDGELSAMSGREVRLATPAEVAEHLSIYKQVDSKPTEADIRKFSWCVDTWLSMQKGDN